MIIKKERLLLFALFASFLHRLVNLCIIACGFMSYMILFQWQKNCIVQNNTVVINMTFVSYFCNIQAGEKHGGKNNKYQYGDYG